MSFAIYAAVSVGVVVALYQLVIKPKLFGRKPVRPASKSVVVTGASSGIGFDAAVDLATRGWTVFAGVRKADDGKALVEAAKGASGKLVPVIIDVTKSESIAACVKEVSAQCPNGLGALVNNAGVIVQGPIEFLELSKARQQLDVNVIGQIDVTQQFMPLLRKHGAGARIVFMSSVAGKVSVAFNGIYAASKFALEAVADALRREIAPWGISVSLVEPSFVETKILTKYDDQVVPSKDLTNPNWRKYYGVYHDNPPKRNAKVVASTEVTNKAIAHALESSQPNIRYMVGVKKIISQIKMSLWLPDEFVDSTLAKSSWPAKNKDKLVKE